MFAVGRRGGDHNIDIRFTGSLIRDVYRLLYENASNEVLSEAYDRRLLPL